MPDPDREYGREKVDHEVREFLKELYSGDEVGLPAMEARVSCALPKLVNHKAWLEANDKNYPGGKVTLSAFHVGPNLNLLADLLERGLAIEREWREIRGRFLDRVHEHALARCRHDILKRRIEDVGQKSVKARERELKAVQEQRSAYDTLIAEAAKLKEEFYSDSLLKGVIAMAIKDANDHEAYAAYSPGELRQQKTSRVTVTWPDNVQSVAQEIPLPESADNAKYLQLAWDRAVVEVLEQERTIKHAGLACHSHEATGAPLKEQEAAKRLDCEAASAQQQRDEEDWTCADQALRIEKRALSRDGYLHYVPTLEGLEARFRRDFQEAQLVAEEARKGLAAMFSNSYEDTCKLPDPESPFYFDQLLVWTRNAVAEMLTVARQEQSFVLPVSLRKAAGGRERFRESIGQGTLSFTLDAQKTKDLLGVSHLYGCRLQGLSAVITSENGKPGALFGITVTPPETSTFEREAGGKGSLKRDPNPPCVLARVTHRDAQREPDVGGTSSLLNASPFGEWTVRVVATSADEYSERSQIDDLQLDLHLCARVTT